MPQLNVRRSIHINADPQEVFSVVTDFRSWKFWSPWLCAEPDARVTVTGTGRDVGDTYSWQGTVVGSGEVEHQILENGRRSDDEIRFLKPWKSVSASALKWNPRTEEPCFHGT
ncbi:MAG: SRPBCC family protein [Planctomycetaceae bacterium]